jgi:hypothetical protein
MKKFELKTHYKKILADTISPVSVYMKVRDKFPNSILLESSDYHGNDNSFSYICCNPIASIKVENSIVTKTYPDHSIESSECALIDIKEDAPSMPPMGGGGMPVKSCIGILLIIHWVKSLGVETSLGVHTD